MHSLSFAAIIDNNNNYYYLTTIFMTIPNSSIRSCFLKLCCYIDDTPFVIYIVLVFYEVTFYLVARGTAYGVEDYVKLSIISTCTGCIVKWLILFYVFLF